MPRGHLLRNGRADPSLELHRLPRGRSVRARIHGAHAVRAGLVLRVDGCGDMRTLPGGEVSICCWRNGLHSLQRRVILSVGCLGAARMPAGHLLRNGRADPSRRLRLLPRGLRVLAWLDRAHGLLAWRIRRGHWDGGVHAVPGRAVYIHRWRVVVLRVHRRLLLSDWCLVAAAMP